MSGSTIDKYVDDYPLKDYIFGVILQRCLKYNVDATLKGYYLSYYSYQMARIFYHEIEWYTFKSHKIKFKNKVIKPLFTHSKNYGNIFIGIMEEISQEMKNTDQ